MFQMPLSVPPYIFNRKKIKNKQWNPQKPHQKTPTTKKPLHFCIMYHQKLYAKAHFQAFHFITTIVMMYKITYFVIIPSPLIQGPLLSVLHISADRNWSSDPEQAILIACLSRAESRHCCLDKQESLCSPLELPNIIMEDSILHAFFPRQWPALLVRQNQLQFFHPEDNKVALSFPNRYNWELGNKEKKDLIPSAVHCFRMKLHTGEPWNFFHVHTL